MVRSVVVQGALSTTGRIKLRVIGVPMRSVVEPGPVTPGVDVPRGIEHLEVEWFVERLSVDALAACKTDEDLYRIRARAELVRELWSLRETARGVNGVR